MTREQCENIQKENAHLLNKYFIQYGSNLKIQLLRMDVKTISGLNDEYFVQCIFKTGDRNLPYFLEEFSKVLEHSHYRLYQNYL